jgi:hypothetical protein
MATCAAGGGGGRTPEARTRACRGAKPRVCRGACSARSGQSAGAGGAAHHVAEGARGPGDVIQLGIRRPGLCRERRVLAHQPPRALEAAGPGLRGAPLHLADLLLRLLQRPLQLLGLLPDLLPGGAAAAGVDAAALHRSDEGTQGFAAQPGLHRVQGRLGLKDLVNDAAGNLNQEGGDIGDKAHYIH